jgi:glycosyltransferase involved in cell wall biosynthesis
MNNNTISIVIPVYNEAGNLELLYDRILKSVSDISDDYQIIFVNDGSKDSSMSRILSFSELNANVFYINLSRNFGHQIAVSAGLEYCNSECTVIIDADLQDPPEIIKDLYEKYKEGYDVVYAKRINRKGESWFKKASAKIFYRILNRVSPIDIPIDSGDFRLINKRVVQELNKMKEHNKFLRGQIAWLGLRQTYVEFERDSRYNGRSGYSVSKMFRLALDAITGFSNKPLLYVSRLGFLISLFSFVVIIFAVFSHFILKETITGWTSLIISVTFIGGIQLLSVGVIGEYISRIYENSKQRPLYVIDSTNIQNNLTIKD